MLFPLHLVWLSGEDSADDEDDAEQSEERPREALLLRVHKEPALGIKDGNKKFSLCSELLKGSR